MTLGDTSQVLEEGNNTLGDLGILTFEKASEVTTDPYFFIPIVILALLPLVIYFFFGFSKAKTTDGRVLEDTMLVQTFNYWLTFFIFLFCLALLVMLIIFPIWLEFFQ